MMSVIEFYKEFMGIPQKEAVKIAKIDALIYRRNEALRKRVAREIEQYEQKSKETEVQKNGAEV